MGILKVERVIYMLGKTKIIIATASVLITGIGAGTGTYLATRDNAETASEVSSMATAIDNAVSTGIGKIESATSAAIQQIESTAQAVQGKAAESKATSSVAPALRKITIDKSVDTPQGLMKFYRIDVDPGQSTVILRLTLPDPEPFLASNPNAFIGMNSKSAKDKNGKTLQTLQDGVVDDRATNDLNNGITIHYTAQNDISKITATWCMDGFPNDPVTITFDIPLE